MEIKYTLKPRAIAPTKAHESDAGYDLYVPDGEDWLIEGHGAITIDTGVSMAIPEGYTGLVRSRSGLAFRNGIMTVEGTVDAGYTGTIAVMLYNLTGKDYVFSPGERMSQIVIVPIANATLVQADELPETERGANGFGSSGR